MADQAEADQLVGGRYRLVAELGSDRRWRAHDERSDTEVTVERVRLPSARAAAERAALFEHGRAEREPRQATALRTNANLVFVEDVVADEDVLWRVTRLVEGRTLADDVSAYGPLDAEAAERIAIDVVAALAAAHQAGIAHGDLSPAAVLLTGTGDALLTGFDADETLAGASVYHAPERKRGEEPRPPGDLFSLGATLYFAVEGDPPIRGGTPETSGAARSEEVAAAEHADGLWPLITRLLAKDPAARPTAREVRALLEPPPAAPAEARDHPDLPPKPGAVPPSKPDRSAMTTTIVIVLLLGAVLAVVIGLNQHNSSTGGTTTTPTTTGETTDDETTTDDTYASSTTTSFDPSSLDDSGTDPTPLTVSALLPDEFTDSQGVTYTRRAAGVHDCLDNGESGTVRTVLSRVGCDQTVSGNYLDQEDKIMVWVVVVPLSDEQTADGAFTDLSGSSTDDWGIRCPHDGAGSAVCDASWDDINRATQYGYIRQDHRYLIHSIAIYADLGQNSDAEPWMDAASSSAVDTAGPENYQ